MTKIIGIDIGGTTIKADIYDEYGCSLDQYQEQAAIINHELKTNMILEQVCDIILNYTKFNSVDGVAISTAGVVNSENGSILYAGYTIPGYSGVDFKSIIAEKFNLPVTVENDVNCAIIGESWLGVAKEKKNIFMVTIGTGIGGSMITNGQLVKGHSYTAGEVGYLPIKKTDWQTLASTTALVKLYEEKSGKSNQTGKTFFRDLKLEDKIAEETLEIFIDKFTQGLVMIAYILNPEMIIIGGGIMAQADILLPKIKESLSKKIIDTRFLPTEIMAPELGNEAGRIGAVKNYLNCIGNK